MTDTADTPAIPGYDFEAETQTEIVASLMRDRDFAKRTYGLVEPSYFESEVEQVYVELARTHFEKYAEAPSPTAWIQITRDALAAGRFKDKTEAGLKLRALLGLTVRSRAWLMDKVAEFAKQQAITQAIIKSATTLHKLTDPDRFAKIEKAMKAATGIKLVEDSQDYDYFATIEERTKERQDIASGAKPKTGIPTGIKELDEILLHGGWGRKELSLFMGGAKATKSWHLMFCAGRAVQAGYNVLFITLENSREITAARFDALFSGVGVTEQFKSPVAMEMGVKGVGAAPRTGTLRIREYPDGRFTPSMLEDLLDEYQANGIIFDLLTIDYLDKMGPSIHSGDILEDKSSIYRESRASAQARGHALLSATQLNREGHKSTVAKAEHVAEDFNRIRIADLVLAINRTDDEKAEAKSRITFAASRNNPDGLTLFCTQDLDKGLAVASVDSVE